MFKNFALGRVDCASKNKREKKWVFFLWIFHGESTREKSTCGGKHPIFMLPATKSRWLK